MQRNEPSNVLRVLNSLWREWQKKSSRITHIVEEDDKRRIELFLLLQNRDILLE